MLLLNRILNAITPLKIKILDFGKITKYKIFGICLLKIKKNQHESIYYFPFYKKIKTNHSNIMNVEFLCSESIKNQTTLFFDLSLGGGTESYFYQQKNELLKLNSVIRVQYFWSLKKYKITLFQLDKEYVLWISTLKNLQETLEKLTLKEIIINNLVGYRDPLAMLNMITKILKKDNVKISTRGHDFASICPFFTLMRDDKFCGGPEIAKCQKCFPVNNYEKKPGKLNRKKIDIKNWRQTWGNFYQNTTDELIVFSQSSYDLFMQAYPNIEHKVKIKPHKVSPLRKAEIKSHKFINIAVLGSITSVAKGTKVVKQMEELIAKRNDVSLIMIGSYKTKNKKTKIIGSYKREDLPKTMEENNVDIVFIPSVWPETFSYTTSEAMLMNLPVACFNLGAPSERISKYEKGLIISEIDANIALDEIIQFIKEQRK